MRLGLLVWRLTHIKLKQITGGVLGLTLKYTERTLAGKIYIYSLIYKNRHTHLALFAEDVVYCKYSNSGLYFDLFIGCIYICYNILVRHL